MVIWCRQATIVWSRAGQNKDLVQTEVVQSRVVIWCSNDLLKSRIGQKAGDGLVMRSFGAEQSKMVQSRVVIWCRAGW